MTTPRKAQRVKIGALERSSGFTRDAIHHYIRLGLLPTPTKSGATVAWYDQRHIDRLQRIRALRARGLSLPLIGRMLDAGGENARIEDLEGLAGLVEARTPRDASTVAAPGPDAFAFAQQLGLSAEAVLADARLGAALAGVVGVSGPALDLATQSAEAVYRSACVLAETRRKLTGAWLARANEGAEAVRLVCDVNNAVGEFAVAVREHLVRTETERGLHQVLKAAESATRARWLPAGSAATAGGVAMLDELDARVAAGDRAAFVLRVRLLYGLGPAKRLREAARSAREAGVDDPWVALATGVARLDAGEPGGARADFALALEQRPGWALATVYNAAAVLLALGPGTAGLLNDALGAVIRLDDADPASDEPVMDGLWTRLVKVQTLLGLPEILGRSERARTLCEEIVVEAAAVPIADPARSSGELARLEGNAWLTLATARGTVGDLAGERAALTHASAMPGPVAHAARARLKATEPAGPTVPVL